MKAKPVTLSPGDHAVIEVARANGIVQPRTAMVQNRRAGLNDYALACAVLEQESAGGQNVFGHDPVRSIVGGPVTKARYLYYKARRKAGLGMQGVGPMQLTYYTYQDLADSLGGCWRPYVNMYVGFGALADLIRVHGFSGGIWRYNGAPIYGVQVLARRVIWRRRFRRARRRARREARSG